MGAISPDLLGKYIKALRGERTQEEMAQIAGIPVYTYLRLEQGVIDRITLEDAAKLAKAFNLTLEQFGALAGVWAVPELDTLKNRRINDLIEVLRNELMPLSDDYVELLLHLYLDLARAIRQQQEDQKEKKPSTLLPKWLQEVAS